MMISFYHLNTYYSPSAIAYVLTNEDFGSSSNAVSSYSLQDLVIDTAYQIP
jgi:hypothetical protein